MNELGGLVLGAAVRGAAFGVLGWSILAMTRRRGPAASATVALATLIGMVGVTVLGAIPRARWWSLAPPARVVAEGPAVPVPQPLSTGPANLPGDASDAVMARQMAEPAGPFDSGVVPALRELGRALMRPPAGEERSSGWGGRAWFAVAFLTAVAVGLARFALGLAAVAALRARSRPETDPALNELAGRLREASGIARPVEIRVAPGLATPATVGWRRPAILLPGDWAGWDDDERRVVLSHELAHIRRRDYLWGIWAQLCLALQYYNPLAHLLAARLRLDQELAADDGGARLSGGPRLYLAALARLALRNDPRPAGWPARSFRPARGTFLRRIEMLRDAHEHASPPTSPTRLARTATFGALALAGLAVAGVRGPGAPGLASAAQAPGANAAPQPAGAADPGYVPSDAGMVLVARPAELLARPEFADLLARLVPGRNLPGLLDLAPAEVEQVTFFWTYDAGPGARAGQSPFWPPSGTLIRTTKPKDAKALAAGFIGGAREARFGERAYYRAGEGPTGTCLAMPDDRTVLLAAEPVLFRMLAARPGATERAPWAEAWKAIERGQLAVAVDPTWLVVRMNAAGAGRPDGPLVAFMPLLDRAHGYALGIDASGPTILIDGVASGNSDEATRQVADTIRAGLILGRNAVESLGNRAKAMGRDVPRAVTLLTDLAVPLLARATVTAEGRTVRFGVSTDLKLTEVVATLIPAADAAQAESKRFRSVNNLKQIGLALHNYHSANGKFPPPILLGPDGKTPHSWRVAILPYLEQQPLYSQYQFNEPWDSVNNRKVLALIPATYRHPGAKSGEAASYFAITGEAAIFSGTEGTGIARITDGTSNTIFVVEAERDIPWTKPEDIPFDPKAAPPKLGGFTPGGFNAGFADGSVRFLKDSISPITLKALFTKAGGEVVSGDR